MDCTENSEELILRTKNGMFSFSTDARPADNSIMLY